MYTRVPVRVWREGGFSRVIFSGAGIAPAMRTFAVSQGIPAGAIEIENRSVSTRENALRTAELLQHLTTRSGPLGISQSGAAGGAASDSRHPETCYRADEPLAGIRSFDRRNHKDYMVFAAGLDVIEIGDSIRGTWPS